MPPSNQCSGYDTKQSDGKTSVILRNAEYHFIAISPKSTLAGVVATDRVLTIGQIELFDIYTERKRTTYAKFIHLK